VTRWTGTRPASLAAIETPEQQIAGLAEQNRLLTAKVDALQAELETQNGIVAALLKRLYGARSEKMSHDQLLLAFLEDEAKKPEAAAGTDVPPAADEPPAPAAPAKTRAPRTNKLADSLKGLPTIVREIIHPAVLAAPDDYRVIGEEISERLHVKPAAFTVEIIKRLVHVLKRDPDAVPVTPPLEPCLLPGSVLTPSLGAYLLTQKFCYHSPFYREQWKLKAAHGIELTRNLMCSWHDQLADRLRPLYDLIAASFRTATYVKIDETPIRCLEPGKGKAGRGQFWVYHHAEHGVLFDCQGHDLKVRLTDVLDRLPAMTNRDDLGALLPSRWQPAAAPAACAAEACPVRSGGHRQQHTHLCMLPMLRKRQPPDVHQLSAFSDTTYPRSPNGYPNSSRRFAMQ
jgi:transposase